jgi:membrane-associated phospholipid phosphatase
MLLWAALVLAVLGALVLALRLDVRAAELFRAHLSRRARHYVRKVTDIAKGAHWLIIAIVVYAGVQIWLTAATETPEMRRIGDLSFALLIAMVAASAILHSIKLVLGRRRPRDHFEHGLHGVKWFAFDTQYDSFPSGHSVTIFCVATIATAASPAFAALWFAVAAALAFTRALLTSHYLSDVLFGAALGLAVARETLWWGFPQLMPAWF